MTNRTNERTNANANKKFAIFITSYNYAEFIGQAIESVINQSDPDWHLYIFDNGSTDNTEEIVKKYLEKDKRISWKKHETNIGSIPNIISGFREIDADYISTLQADDWLEPNFVADAKKAFAENPEIPFCAFGWVAVFYDKNLQRLCGVKTNIPLPENFQNKIFLSPFLAFGNIIPIHLLVFKKDLLCSKLQDIENLKLQQILEIMLMKNLEDKYGAGYLNKNIHGYWRRHDKQITKTNNENFQTAIETFSEPFFYCSTTNNELTKSKICNRFISVLSILLQTQMSYYKAVNWLLSDLGKPFLEKFCNFKIPHHISQKSIFCVAISSFIAHIYFADYAGFNVDIKQAKSELFLWIKELKQKYKELKTIKDFFDEANQIYGGYFMPENAVKKLEKFIKKDSWLFN